MVSVHKLANGGRLFPARPDPEMDPFVELTLNVILLVSQYITKYMNVYLFLYLYYQSLQCPCIKFTVLTKQVIFNQKYKR